MNMMPQDKENHLDQALLDSAKKQISEDSIHNLVGPDLVETPAETSSLNLQSLEQNRAPVILPDKLVNETTSTMASGNAQHV